MEELMSKAKPFTISRDSVKEAYKLVYENKGSAGVDGQTIEDFHQQKDRNLYKIWNRMSSGTYFPPPVKAVPIPKKSGGERLLGIPTVSDRIAQAIVLQAIVPILDKVFLPDSYAYRPGRSAEDAIASTRERCWRYNWVLEYDIKGLFDNIPHDMLMKAVKFHVKEKWIIICIERWLTAPMQMQDGQLIPRTCGTPQGGVVSPVLANLFLHYVIDKWLQRTFPHLEWCRYADDGLIHCQSEKQARLVMEALRNRLRECGLEMHPEKTKIVYCKDGRRRGDSENTEFDFLGFTFRSRMVQNSYTKSMFCGYSPAASKTSLNNMRDVIRKLRISRRTNLSLEIMAKILNPKLVGWYNYFGSFHPSELYKVWKHVNRVLMLWARNKFKRIRKGDKKAREMIRDIAERQPKLFFHWFIGCKRGVV